MESIIQQALNTHVMTKANESGGGCINQGQSYNIDTGKVFIKFNSRTGAQVMFDGEYAGLRAISATNTVAVPHPLCVIQNPEGGAAIVLEFLGMKSLNKFSDQLGKNLAALHLHNPRRSEPSSFVGTQETDSYTSQFGFPIATSCGYLAQDNSWCDEWVIFFTRQRLDYQFKLIEKEYGDRDVRELWSQLVNKIPSFFNDLTIRPSLLHGDLWSGNVAETEEGPVIIDPASFYGHHEYELSIAKMFGGFNKAFHAAYHDLIPKANGFETRQKLYQLFHYLNHWNHFGTEYRNDCITIMKYLLK